METVKKELKEESEDILVASPSIIEEVIVAVPHETHVSIHKNQNHSFKNCF